MSTVLEAYRTPAELRQKRGFDGVYEKAVAHRELVTYERELALTDPYPRTIPRFDKPVHMREMLSGNPLSAGVPMYKRADRSLMAVIVRKIRGPR